MPVLTDRYILWKVRPPSTPPQGNYRKTLLDEKDVGGLYERKERNRKDEDKEKTTFIGTVNM
jgi:hypothetical protein